MLSPSYQILDIKKNFWKIFYEQKKYNLLTLLLKITDCHETDYATAQLIIE
jgi:hypothetical protein